MAAATPDPERRHAGEDVKGAVRDVQKRVDIRQIVGFSQTVAWNSPSPTSQNAAYADLELIDWALRHDRVAELPQAWLSCVVREGGMLLRQSDASDSQPWLFGLTDVCSVIGLGWPAKEEQLPMQVQRSCKVFVPSLGPECRRLHPIPMVNLTDWIAIPYRWESPLARCISSKGQLRNGGASLVAVPTGEADAVLRTAARACFWSLPLTTLRQLGRHLIGTGFDQHASLLETLRALVLEALECSENDLVAILRKRLGGDSFNTDEFLDLEGAEAVLKKSDLAKAKKTVEMQKTQRSIVIQCGGGQGS